MPSKKRSQLDTSHPPSIALNIKSSAKGFSNSTEALTFSSLVIHGTLGLYAHVKHICIGHKINDICSRKKVKKIILIAERTSPSFQSVDDLDTKWFHLASAFASRETKRKE